MNTQTVIKNRHGANYNGIGIVDLLRMNKLMFFITFHLIQSNHFWLAKKAIGIH